MNKSVFDVVEVERNGRVFLLHWKNRYDPVTLLVLGGIGVGAGVLGTLQEGKQAEKIAERRAEIDIADAKAIREASIEEARIKREKGQRLIEKQKGVAAAGGIRLNVGVPLVITEETQADITKDIGFGLERGRVEVASLRERAGLEKALGKQARKRSQFSALTQGLLGAATLGFQARSAGLFTKTPGLPSGLPRVGQFSPQVGATLARF